MASLKVQCDFGYQAAVAGASGVSAARSCAERVTNQEPSNRHRGQTGMVPDGGAGREFDDAIGAAVPEGDGMALPDSPGVLQHLVEFGQALSLDRRPSAALASGRCGSIQVGVEAQSGDDAEIASDSGKEFDGGKCGVADDDDA